jgi:hypothetical protein
MRGVLSNSPMYLFMHAVIKFLSVYVYLLVCIIIYIVYIYAVELFGIMCMSLHSSVDIVTSLAGGRPRNGGSLPSRGIFVSLLRC